MSNYDWSIYDREWGEWPPKRQGEFLTDTLELYGDPVALAWFPHSTLPPKLERYIYKGELKMVHCSSCREPASEARHTSSRGT